MTTVKSPRIPVRLTILPLVLALGACASPRPQAARRAAAGPVRRAAPARRRRHGGVAQHYEQGAQPVPQWWKRYGSPELDALVEEGLAKNPDLAGPLAGRGPRAAARPDQLVPDAQRGRRRRGLAQAR